MREAFADLMLALPVEALVPGEPVGIDQLAQSMLRWSELFADAAQALARIEVIWTGQAADAFQAQFGLQPAAFRAAATAMDEAGYALGSYGIAFHSAREAAAVALETFQRGVRAGLAARTVTAAVVAGAGGGLLPTSGPVDLRDEPAGLQDRLAGVEKLTAARQALLGAGERATTTIRDAMAHAPEQVSAVDHGANFMTGEWNQERADFTVGAARGLLDLAAQAGPFGPLVAPVVMAPVNDALDGLEWRWNIGSGSGFHHAGAFIIPTLATGGAGGLEARAPRVVAEIITPKGVNPEPVILYRGMRAAEDGYPETGATAKTLGARVKVGEPQEKGDVPVDQAGRVFPRTGGMSANTDPTAIPSFRRPLAFGGRAKDIDMFVIDDHALPEGLTFRPVDGGHGFIEPTRPMTYDEMQRLIHATRTQWRQANPPE